MNHRLVLITFLAASAAASLACRGHALRPRLVPGTEHLEPAGNEAWFTISPDEKWQAFFEVDSLDWNFKGLRTVPEKFHFVTMNLETSEKTHHCFQAVAERVQPEIPRSMEDRARLFFEQRSWSGDRVRLRMLQSFWVAFTPGQIAPEVINRPSGSTCCACPPYRDWDQFLKSQHLDPYDQATATYRDGQYSNVIYAFNLSKELWETGVVDRLDPDGSRHRIFEDKRSFRTVIGAEILVSPDESHLALLLVTNLKSSVPLPARRLELHVVDLRTGKHSRVRQDYRVAGNLMWSEDSKRLYYAAVDGAVADGRGDGVFCVDFK